VSGFEVGSLNGERQIAVKNFAEWSGEVGTEHTRLIEGQKPPMCTISSAGESTIMDSGSLQGASFKSNCRSQRDGFPLETGKGESASIEGPRHPQKDGPVGNVEKRDRIIVLREVAVGNILTGDGQIEP